MVSTIGSIYIYIYIYIHTYIALFLEDVPFLGFNRHIVVLGPNFFCEWFKCLIIYLGFVCECIAGVGSNRFMHMCLMCVCGCVCMCVCVCVCVHGRGSAIIINLEVVDLRGTNQFM